MVLSAYALGQYGARRFLFMNSPDIGLTPEARIVRNNAAAATAATVQYNQALAYLAGNLSFTNQQIFQFDTFNLLNVLYQDALTGGTHFGITNATLPCFPGFAGSPGADCSKSLFADDIHPTAITQSLLALAVNNQVHNPEPATIGLTGAALMVLGWYKRRRKAS